MDYEKLGLRVGLEIHRQLDTHKLFCNCASELREEVGEEMIRMLRPTQSELGDVDKAAIEESRRSRTFLYQATDTTCLVEADEEPPHSANEEAIDIVLEIALLLRAKPVEEIEFMRKIVIDGSNTTGFQRTALIALGGMLETSKGDVGISLICLEEDAARKIEAREGRVTYRIDRLGIPLVEIATEPDIKTPLHAMETAEKLGSILRATGKVKRGLGTIRQDLNISIAGGARIEVKGVQELRAIPHVVEQEVQRQLRLIEIKDMLIERGVKEEDLKSDFVDVSEEFRNTKSEIIRRKLEKGGKVLALKLKGFGGLLMPGPDKKHAWRLGRALAEHAVIAGAGGIFHSDELPGYGIMEDEVTSVQRALGISNTREDAFVIVAEREAVARSALELVVERAKVALRGVPREVRRALPDNTTEYMRPMPGPARMYPETDIPPVRISQARLDRIRGELPELLEDRRERLVIEYGIAEEQAKQLIQGDYADIFETLVKHGAPPKVVATTFLSTFPELKNEGVDLEKITERILEDVFSSFNRGVFAKEAIPELLSYIAKHGVSVGDAVKSLGLVTISEDEVARIIQEILDEKEELVKERGMGALGALMGIAMSRLRGKADGRMISNLLKRKLKEFNQ